MQALTPSISKKPSSPAMREKLRLFSARQAKTKGLAAAISEQLCFWSRNPGSWGRDIFPLETAEVVALPEGAILSGPEWKRTKEHTLPH